MRSLLPTLLTSLTLATALPAPDITRTLPTNWQYRILSLSGPGCPDLANPSPSSYTTRLTFGQNTMDGSEIYYWFIAYPHLRVDLASTTHSWCETELQYNEYKDLEGKEESDEYRLRVHKNGTRVIATYELDEGVSAKFRFEYDHKATDTISWNGPFSSGEYQQEHSSPVAADEGSYKLPKCGKGTIKFRTDLWIEGGKGKKGYVASEHRKDEQGVEQYYGVQQGFSYDWEKCKK